MELARYVKPLKVVPVPGEHDPARLCCVGQDDVIADLSVGPPSRLAGKYVMSAQAKGRDDRVGKSSSA